MADIREGTAPDRSEGTARRGALAPAARGPLPPVRRITVLYDGDCALCRAVTRWLAHQPKLIGVDLLQAGSPRARNRYPDLDHAATLGEITVVGGSGEVWTGAAAWITVLWALRSYRRTAFRLATPAGLPVARATVLTAARIRAITRRTPVGSAEDEHHAYWTNVRCDERCHVGQ
jgi:predicted DCC family thiol-disulfide oxidoreductase YuxK